MHIALACSREGKSTEARQVLRELVALEMEDVLALNNTAWSLATSPVADLRDGPGAVHFAEKAVARTNRKNVNLIDTLAAAYAEAGDFTNAISVQKEAISLSNNDALKEEMRLRLKLYESGSPYRERE